MRWRFFDPAIPSEFMVRERVLASIDAWWAEFARRAEDLPRRFKRELELDLPAWMAQHLGAVDERLCWEFGPPLRGSGHRLVITPESARTLRPLVATLLERAPRLPGWEFYPHRPAESAEEALGTVEGRVGRRYADVQARLEPGDHNRVNVIFRSPEFRSSEDKQATDAAFVFAETLLGEQALDRWVGVIEAEPPPRSVLRRFFGGRPADSEQFVALDQVRAAFAAQVKVIQEKLPDRAWHEIDTDNHEWTGFQFQPGQQAAEHRRADLIVGSSPFMAMAEAAIGDNFHSERFSRFGETFCYLKVDRGEGVEPKTADEREPAEQAIDGVLVPARLGRSIGGGTGLRHFYVDLALTDVDRAVPLLRERLAKLVPRRSWLLFDDCELADEWIGIHPDTPAPPAQPPDLG